MAVEMEVGDLHNIAEELRGRSEEEAGRGRRTPVEGPG